MPKTIPIVTSQINRKTLAEELRALALKIPVGEAMQQEDIGAELHCAMRNGYMHRSLQKSGCSISLKINGHIQLCLCHPQTAKKYADRSTR